MPACSRCVKAGQASNCLYIDDAADVTTRNTDSAVALANAEFSRGPLEGHYTRPIQADPQAAHMLSRLEYQDRRIKQLETALSQATQHASIPPLQQLKQSHLPLTPESPADYTAAPVNATDRETMLLRGKSFKTQFHGITHPSSLIAYIPELNVFTKDSFEQMTGLMRIRHDMKALEDRRPYLSNVSDRTTDADLRALLPPREEADSLVQLYLDSYDLIYHIIHLPTFRQQYNAVWTEQTESRGHVLTLVLLMIAAVQCLQAKEPWLYRGNSSTAREKAITAIAK